MCIVFLHEMTLWLGIILILTCTTIIAKISMNWWYRIVYYRTNAKEVQGGQQVWKSQGKSRNSKEFLENQMKSTFYDSKSRVFWVFFQVEGRNM